MLILVRLYVYSVCGHVSCEYATVRRAIHTVRSYMVLSKHRCTIQDKADAGWCDAEAALKQRGIPLHFLDREVTITAAFSVAAYCFHRAELEDQFCLACEELCRELGSDFLSTSIRFQTSLAGYHNKSIYPPYATFAKICREGVQISQAACTEFDESTAAELGLRFVEFFEKNCPPKGHMELRINVYNKGETKLSDHQDTLNLGRRGAQYPAKTVVFTAYVDEETGQVCKYDLPTEALAKVCFMVPGDAQTVEVAPQNQSVYTMGELQNAVLLHGVSPAAELISGCMRISIVCWIYYDLKLSIVRDYTASTTVGACCFISFIQTHSLLTLIHY